MRVFLIGMMGSGKSFWAHKLSALFNISAFDLDDVIEKQAGKTISEIFETEGENSFRQIEQDCLHSFQQKDDFILATGGGTPFFFDNMDWMNEHGITIWIDEPIEIIANRLIKEKNHRPLIKNIPYDELLSFLINKREERKPFYSKAQHHLYQGDLNEQHFLEIINHE